MVEVAVKFMSFPRQRKGTGSAKFVSSGSKLRSVLKEIVDSYRIGDIIPTESSEVRPYARILVNGRAYQFMGSLDVELHDGDAVALIYPWIGHEDF